MMKQYLAFSIRRVFISVKYCFEDFYFRFCSALSCASEELFVRLRYVLCAAVVQFVTESFRHHRSGCKTFIFLENNLYANNFPQT